MTGAGLTMPVVADELAKLGPGDGKDPQINYTAPLPGARSWRRKVRSGLPVRWLTGAARRTGTTLLEVKPGKAATRRRMWRSMLGVAAAFVAFVMLITAFPNSAQAAPTAYQYYEIVSRHSGGCVEVDYGRTYFGADVTEDWCFGSVDYQRWQFRPVAGEPGWYQIAVRHSGKCLSVKGAYVVDGANVIQEDCTNVDNRKWKLVDLSDGYVQLVAKHSGKCLDLAGGDWDIVQWYCWTGNNQQWRLR